MMPRRTSNTRVELCCRGHRCPRRLSLPLDLYQRSHEILCDRCGNPMKVIAATAGIDPYPGQQRWYDDEASTESPVMLSRELQPA